MSTTMIKPLLFLVIASLAVISTLRVRTSYILRPNPNPSLSSSSPHLRRLESTARSSVSSKLRKFFNQGNDPRTVDAKDETTNYKGSISRVQERKFVTRRNPPKKGIMNYKDDVVTPPPHVTPLPHLPRLEMQKIFGQGNNQQTANHANAKVGTNHYKPPTAPLHVCERRAPIPHDIDMRIMNKYAICPLLNSPPETTNLLVLEGLQTFGRTGNNLIEFLHSLQYANDNNAVVAIMHGSWAPIMIVDMWMAIQDDIDDWREFMERAFCVKILDTYRELDQYKNVTHMDTRALFILQHRTPLREYIEFQTNIIRTLYRSYNNGIGYNMRRGRVRDMCSVLDAMFGNEKQSAVYSVIHSRSLEGDPGKILLKRISKNSGTDPLAALDMEPEYVKAILEPLGMLEYPIVFITDQQRPEVLEKLRADPDIGPKILLVPQEASWVGGDLTVALMSNVFIGNPASTFSGFIAKSRVALGYDKNYLFRRKDEFGQWSDVCDHRCIFNKKVMNIMA